jgi:hypothetical protein
MKEVPTKKTFGGCDIDHLRPKADAGLPAALNVVVSFEDALKLHLALGQALAKLNGYNRSTSAGRRSAVNLCIHAGKRKQGITVNEGTIRTPESRRRKGPPGPTTA